MTTLKHLLATTLATTVGLAVVAAGTLAPAHADPGTVQVSSGPGVVFEECADHPLSYAVQPPADANHWNLRLVVQAPDGTATGGYIVASSGDPTTGVVTARLCGSETGAGAYTVTGTYQYYQGRITPTATIPVTPFTFDMRLPAGAVAASPSTSTPRLGQAVKVRVKVTEEQSTGEFRGTDSAKVLLQRLAQGRWVKVRGAKAVTTGNGAAKLRFRQAWKGKARFRAFANLGYVGRAASPSFVLRTRR
jgi:hypothetical protein